MTDSRLYCGCPLADFNLAFTAGHRFQRDEYQYEMEVVPIGDLCLPTGKIVASDPSNLDDHFEDYFETVVPPGTYPVDMALLHGKTTDGSQTFLTSPRLAIPSKPPANGVRTPCATHHGKIWNDALPRLRRSESH